MWEEGLTLRHHSLKTEDGYILTVMHIIPYDETFDAPEMRTLGTVLLGHSGMMDGLSWFETEHSSLPALLVKAGYNVYLTNDRGTRNSRRHESLSPVEDAKKYFDYSFAELGVNDAPAVLNFVQTHSGGERVIYIGYSQSSTSILYAFGQSKTSMLLRGMISDVILLAPCLFLSEPMMQVVGLDQPMPMAK